MRRRLGLEESVLRRAVGKVSRAEISELSVVEEIFARAVWTRLTEPGDAVAGAVIREFGSVRALEAVVENASSLSLASAPTGSSWDVKQSDDLSAGLLRWRSRLDLASALRDFDIAQRFGMHIVTPEMEAWPTGFNDLDVHAPHALWVRGDERLLSTRSLAVVGSRAATSYGETVTAELVTGVASRGVTIISGGAYGIDGVAHRTCLATDSPTIAVLAGGADRLYPSGHERLLHRITESGLVFAEQSPGSSPTRWRFLQRNRLIAAMSVATLVCEAGHRSGSLNTAGHAAQLGRPIGAVPGSIFSASSAGCHRLFREYDAACIRSSDDVLELLGAGAGALPVNQIDSSSQGIRVRDALSKTAFRELSRIAVLAGLTEREAFSGLSELAMQNVAEHREGHWRLRPAKP